jgi:signal peptidase I
MPGLMREPALLRCFCRIYRALLYAYPRPFRLQYGAGMEQVFRDRCAEVARANDSMKMVHFFLHSGADWITTSIRERVDAARTLISGARKAAPRGLVNEWVLTILMYLFATTTLVQAYVIPTGSMEGNLRVGDHMLVDRAAYAKPGALGRHVMPYQEIKRGDIVAFLYPEDPRQTFVKRVIGLPGDRIRLAGKQVIRNGRALTEPYTQHTDSSIERYRDDFPTMPGALTTPRGREMFEHHIEKGEVQVPPGALFVLGDNRDNSADSRYWGFVPREYVVGKPLFVYWSYDAPTAELEQWTIAHIVDVMEHFFTKTRWERTFLVPRSQQAEEDAARPPGETAQ